MAGEVPLVYILGTPYCGSTLLGFLLGASHEVFNAGEIQHFTRFQDIRSRLCSCGKQVYTCPVWGPLEFSRFRLFSKLTRRGQIMVSLRLLSGQVPLRPFASGADDAAFLHLLRKRLDRLGYKVSYILDNSKTPFRLMHLLTFDSLDIRILHLTRSIHGNMASFVKSDEGFWRGLARYLLRHWLMERLLTYCERPYLRISYEALCLDPAKELGRIGRFLSIDIPQDVVKAVRESTQHVFTGNVWRHEFAKNFRGISLDTSWKKALSANQIHILDSIVKLNHMRNKLCPHL